MNPCQPLLLLPKCSGEQEDKPGYRGPGVGLWVLGRGTLMGRGSQVTKPEGWVCVCVCNGKGLKEGILCVAEGPVPMGPR